MTLDINSERLCNILPKGLKWAPRRAASHYCLSDIILNSFPVSELTSTAKDNPQDLCLVAAMQPSSKARDLIIAMGISTIYKAIIESVTKNDQNNFSDILGERWFEFAVRQLPMVCPPDGLSWPSSETPMTIGGISARGAKLVEMLFVSHLGLSSWRRFLLKLPSFSGEPLYFSPSIEQSQVSLVFMRRLLKII